MFKFIDNFFLSLEGKSQQKAKRKQPKGVSGIGANKPKTKHGHSLGSLIYNLYVKGHQPKGVDGLDGWKDDKEKFKIDLINDIKTFLFTKWEKPWNPGLIFNAAGEVINGFRNIHGRVYKKSENVLCLDRNKGKSPFFITISNVEKQGGQITDPTKKTMVISMVPIPKEDDPKKIQFAVPRYHSVINVDFVEGIKKPIYKTEEFKGFELNEYVENFIKLLVILKRVPRLHYDQSDKAFYARKMATWEGDSIHLVPIKNFKGMEEYYSTLFHEIIHSTMNPNRCGRGKVKSIASTLEYAHEELVAEMGAMILSSELGLEYNRQNSISYLKGWLTRVGKDSDIAMVEAYAFACDAVEYLIKDINFEKLIPKGMAQRASEKQEKEGGEPTPGKPKIGGKRKKVMDKSTAKGKKKATVTVKKARNQESLKLQRTKPEELPYRLGYDAYRGISFSPEKRAANEQADYADHLNTFAQELENIAVSEEQQKMAIEEFSRYKEKYTTLLKARLSALSRCLSPMITGPSNFPTRRNEKANKVEGKRLEELLQYSAKAQQAIKKRIKGFVDGDSKNSVVKNEVLRRLAGIVEASRPGSHYSKSLFVANLKGYIERLHDKGQNHLVNDALKLVRETQEKFKIIVFAPKNEVWTWETTDGDSVPGSDATQRENELILETDSVQIINNFEAERVQIIFPGKPSQEIINYLKQKAFKWAPSNKAWQRVNTPFALKEANIFADKFYPGETKNPIQRTTAKSEIDKPIKTVTKATNIVPQSQDGKVQEVKKSGFFYSEDSHNIEEIEGKWLESIDYKMLKHEMGELAPRHSMILTGIPMNYPNKKKIYFDDIHGNINIKPIPIKVKKQEPFEALFYAVGKDLLRPIFSGVYQDAENDYMVASDSHQLVAIKEEIKGESLTLNKYKQPIDGIFPKWKSVTPDSRHSIFSKKINLQELLNEASGLINLKKITNQIVYLCIGTPKGMISLAPKNVEKAIKPLLAVGIKEVEFHFFGSNKAVKLEDISTGSLAIIMPIMPDNGFDNGVPKFPYKILKLTTDSTEEPMEPASFGLGNTQLFDFKKKKDSADFVKLGSGERPKTYQLSGDLGRFLGEYDRLHYSIVLRGDKGAGKSRLLFQLMNGFAEQKLKIAFLSLEMHPQSSVSQRYTEEYINKTNLSQIDVTGHSLTYDELNKLCKQYDVLAIDSWTKLKEIEQNDFDRLQQENPETIILSVFQSTTGKVTRGGNMPEYDAGTVIHVHKGGIAECEKNRYSPTDVQYHVFEKSIIEQAEAV